MHAIPHGVRSTQRLARAVLSLGSRARLGELARLVLLAERSVAVSVRVSLALPQPQACVVALQLQPRGLLCPLLGLLDEVLVSLRRLHLAELCEKQTEAVHRAGDNTHSMLATRGLGVACHAVSCWEAHCHNQITVLVTFLIAILNVSVIPETACQGEPAGVEVAPNECSVAGVPRKPRANLAVNLCFPEDGECTL